MTVVVRETGAQAGKGDGEVAPWVAARYDTDRPDRVGAERSLDSAVLRGAFVGRWSGRRQGPRFQPYWPGAGEATSAGPVGARRPDRPDQGLRCNVARVVGRRILDWSLVLSHESYGEELWACAEGDLKLDVSVSGDGAWP